LAPSIVEAAFIADNAASPADGAASDAPFMPQQCRRASDETLRWSES